MFSPERFKARVLGADTRQDVESGLQGGRTCGRKSFGESFFYRLLSFRFAVTLFDQFSTPEMRLVVAAFAACCAVAHGACVTPFIGQDLTIEDCSSGSQFVSWDWLPGSGHGCTDCGALALRQSGGTLCVTVNGTNPSTGQPNLSVGRCNTGERRLIIT